MTRPSDPARHPGIRLAMRVEGNWWVAYCAKAGTMEGAKEIGRITLGIVQDEERKQAFMNIMMSAMSDFLRDVTGQRPDWEVGGAPEHERSGRA